MTTSTASGSAFDAAPGSAFGTESVHLVALDGVIRGLELMEQRIRAAEAERISLLAQAFDIAALESKRVIASTPSDRASELAYRAVRAEVAAALHQSERTTEQHMDHAVTLTRQYPSTFEAYRAGLVSERHTRVIADAGAVIGPGDAPDTVLRRGSYETAVLEVALAETPNRLQPIARRCAEQFAEAPLDDRHAEARTRRQVFVVDRDDGMADLVAHIPAVEAYGIYRRLTRMSREIERTETPSSEDAAPPRRLRDEIRADALADLLLGGHLSSSGRPDGSSDGSLDSIRAQVQIVIPAEALGEAATGFPGITDGSIIPFTVSDRLGDPTAPAPAVLGGYGPVDPTTAKRISGEAGHWDLVRTHPTTGDILSVDRYRPNEQMRRLLGARDQHCRFPGCRVPLARCDLDHTVDAQYGGPTAIDNLAHLCRGHHTIKHHTGWRVRQQRDGTLYWTSPTGRHHIDRPPGGRVAFEPSVLAA